MSFSSKISFFNILFLSLIIILVYHNFVDIPLIFSYQTHKMLHLLGFAMFLANVFVGPLWMFYGLKSKNIPIMKFSIKMLLLTDVLFTVPGLILLVFNGLAMNSAFENSHFNWLRFSVLSLFLLWILVLPVLYFQEKLRNAIELENEEKITYFKKMWIVSGLISAVPLLVICFLMIYKQEISF